MLEVLFSDSAAGSLKAAICRRNPPDESAGGIGIVAADANGKPLSPEELEQLRRDTQEKLRRQWADAVPLEGSPQDILPFSLSLSVGPLDGDGIGPLRENVLEQLLCIFPEGRQAAAEIVRAAQRSLGTLLARAPHEPVRFWTDRTPDAACGLCWALEQLRPLGFAHLDLRVVDLSCLGAEGEPPFGGRCAGEIHPHKWGRLARETRPLPADRAEALANHWRILRQEDAPLRAMLNGVLVSAAIDLYDPYLRAVLDEMDDTFQEAVLIGRTLAKFPLGFSDAWLALRVEQWIADGKLAAVTKPDADSPAYHRTLRKTED